MWSKQKDEFATPQRPEPVRASAPQPSAPPSPAQAPASVHASASTASIGASMRIKGEIRSREELLVDGQVEGLIESETNTRETNRIRSGSAMSPKKMQNTPCWRMSRSMAASGEGTGLGLDIAQRIVRNHKGSIRVEVQTGTNRFSGPLAPMRSWAGTARRGC